MINQRKLISCLTKAIFKKSYCCMNNMYRLINPYKIFIEQEENKDARFNHRDIENCNLNRNCKINNVIYKSCVLKNKAAEC